MAVRALNIGSVDLVNACLHIVAGSSCPQQQSARLAIAARGTSSSSNGCSLISQTSTRGGFGRCQSRPWMSSRARPLEAHATASMEKVTRDEVPLESDAGVSYENLRDKLAGGEWEEADNETRRLLCVLAGEGAVKRKWVYYSEVQYIPQKDLITMDNLWKHYSNGRYGFSVQRRIWRNCDKRWKPFFKKIGWTIGEADYLRKFPVDFMWNNDDTTPIGHMPLTNALRGTQLIEKILDNEAFAKYDSESEMSYGDDRKDLYSMPSTPSSNGASASSSAKPPGMLNDIDFSF